MNVRELLHRRLTVISNLVRITWIALVRRLIGNVDSNSIPLIYLSRQIYKTCYLPDILCLVYVILTFKSGTVTFTYVDPSKTIDTIGVIGLS